MKAMILGAGYGRRLRPLTERLPKPLLPIGGRPLLEWNLLLLKKHGITDALINLHHLGNQIVEAFGDGSRYGMRLAYSHEPMILGTGGGIKQAQPYFEDRPVLVLNGDTLSDCDLTALLKTHRARRALATLAVREDPHAAQWGAITMKADWRILQIKGEPPLVGAHQGEGGTGHLLVDTETPPETLGEDGLAGTELARQQQDVSRPRQTGHGGRQLSRVVR